MTLFDRSSSLELWARIWLLKSLPGENNDGHDVADQAEDGDGREEDAFDDEPEAWGPFGGRSAKAGWPALLTWGQFHQNVYEQLFRAHK